MSGAGERVSKIIAKGASPLISKKYDKALLDILAYVLQHGPTTIYRAARDLPYSISLTYKKANRMLEEGLIKKVQEEYNRTLYEPTAKGILTCLVYGCLDEAFLVERLMQRWGLSGISPRALVPIFRVLPYVIRPSDITLLEDPKLLSMAILSDGKKLDQLGPEVAREAKVAALRTLMGEFFNMLINCEPKVSEGSTEAGLIISSEDFTIHVDPANRSVFVYNCRRCKSNCSMVSFSFDSPNCKYLSDVYRRISFVFLPEQAAAKKKA